MKAKKGRKKEGNVRAEGRFTSLGGRGDEI